MAWRIEELVVKGEIDNRERGRVTGRIWLVGRDEPMVLELKGNAWRDLAGHLLKFTNPNPQAGDLKGLCAYQEGMAGDITASRKVKVPECTMEELMEFYAAKQEFPWHWGNSLYLEWFGSANGRVLIESASYQLELDSEPTWTMTEAEEEEQRAANADAMMDFMGRMGMIAGDVEVLEDDEEDEDAPRSLAEAEADEEDARMALLMDRVQARIEREGKGEIRFDEIYQEERARLMRERGEVEHEPTPAEQEERRRWIEEVNAAAMEALADQDAEVWKEEDDFEGQHPLVGECVDLSVRLHRDVHGGTWLPEDAHREHPLIEIVDALMCAGAKLAGALCMTDPDEWPPDPLIAGNVLVRLKKARGYLRDAMRALDSAEEESLATPKWRHHTRMSIIVVLAETQDLIREAREVLDEDDDDLGIF